MSWALVSRATGGRGIVSRDQPGQHISLACFFSLQFPWRLHVLLPGMLVSEGIILEVLVNVFAQCGHNVVSMTYKCIPGKGSHPMVSHYFRSKSHAWFFFHGAVYCNNGVLPAGWQAIWDGRFPPHWGYCMVALDTLHNYHTILVEFIPLASRTQDQASLDGTKFSSEESKPELPIRWDINETSYKCIL